MSTYPVDIRLNVAKVDARAKTVTGWAAVVTRDDGTPVIDADDHMIPVEVLKRAVQDAFAEHAGKGKVGVNHEKASQGAADIVEMFVATNEVKEAINKSSPEDMPFFGPSRKEGWIAVMRIHNAEIIKRLESGELQELSLKGAAKGRWV